MATHSGILVRKIPWTEEAGGLHSVGSQRVGHNWATEHIKKNKADLYILIRKELCEISGFLEGTSGKELLPTNAGDIRDVGSIPWSGRSPEGGHGNPLQYSCLENSMDRGAWWVIAHRVTKSWSQLKWRHTYTHTHTHTHTRNITKYWRRADSLEKTLMLGKIEGRRRRGWQRMRWLDGITN